MKFNQFLTFIISTLAVSNNLYAMHDNDNCKYLFYPNINEDIKSNINEDIKSNIDKDEFNDDVISIHNHDNLINEINALNRDLMGNEKEKEKFNNIDNQMPNMLFNSPLFFESPICNFHMINPMYVINKFDAIDNQQNKIYKKLDHINDKLKEIHKLIMNKNTNNVLNEKHNTNMEISTTNRIIISGNDEVENNNSWKLIEGNKKRQRKPK